MAKTYRIYITYTTYSGYHNARAEYKMFVERPRHLSLLGAQRIVRREKNIPDAIVTRLEHYLYA